MASPANDSLVPPSYSPSLPAPKYSCEPSCDEQRLEQTPRSGRRPTPTGTFVRKSGKATLVLNDQEDNARQPSYGRHGVISGTLILEEYSSVSEVVLKVSRANQISTLNYMNLIYLRDRID